ncbi:MAG TPA: FAD-dependent tricarballylate dehydrogenase TcuA [Vicinamibacterales bacterium]|nr:FAD-dependent tricarballylate dehydrogenase TcuA [Vicinamibacterales bacterium]
MNTFDVVVVGAGNAAFCAAHAARERVDSVLMLEKAPRAWIGGNSYFSAGAFRTTYRGLDDLRPLLDLREDEAARIDLPAYTPDDFRADMLRVTEGRCDPELTEILVGEVAETARWMRDRGVRWKLQFERQSFEVDGRRRFWGNLPLGTVREGVGMIEQHLSAAGGSGVELRCESPARRLLREGRRVVGVVVEGPDGLYEVRAGAVVLACGGFEADPRMRAMYLGPGWDVARVRGTPYNTGEGLTMAIEAGAQPYGHWSGCHAIQWDAAAPPTGDRELLHRLSKQSYPLGIMVNREGQRFVDEGADFRNYTYAKYGAEVLKQPGATAFQLFDARTVPLLRQDEYSAPGVSRHEAGTVEDLADALGIDRASLTRTVDGFNAAVQSGPFDPTIKDGKRTTGIDPPKSNWALPLDTPPFVAFAVTCGITFTFGGIRIDRDARVLDERGTPIPGLYAAGELVGGLFYHNYPGGSGLASGSVFGRRAGAAAGDQVSQRHG